jgi:hypothetical protein
MLAWDGLGNMLAGSVNNPGNESVGRLDLGNMHLPVIMFRSRPT